MGGATRGRGGGLCGICSGGVLLGTGGGQAPFGVVIGKGGCSGGRCNVDEGGRGGNFGEDGHSALGVSTGEGGLGGWAAGGPGNSGVAGGDSCTAGGGTRDLLGTGAGGFSLKGVGEGGVDVDGGFGNKGGDNGAADFGGASRSGLGGGLAEPGSGGGGGGTSGIVVASCDGNRPFW